jgi:hypothetical protein
MNKSAYEPKLYRSPLDLPEATSGGFSVRHKIYPAGASMPIINMREAFTRGRNPLSVTLPRPLRVHELHEEDAGTWMTDAPQELNQIAEMLYEVQPTGEVLVGGLGLGVLASILVAREGVASVTVVERSSDVKRLCAKRGYHVVLDDIDHYLRTHEEPYDFYLLDTWQGTNEGTWWEEVMPLRRIIRNRFGRRSVVHCWAEDMMLGQVCRSALNMAGRVWYYQVLAKDADEEEVAWFLGNVGTREWERRYGRRLDEIKPPVAGPAREEER